MAALQSSGTILLPHTLKTTLPTAHLATRTLSSTVKTWHTVDTPTHLIISTSGTTKSATTTTTIPSLVSIQAISLKLCGTLPSRLVADGSTTDVCRLSEIRTPTTWLANTIPMAMSMENSLPKFLLSSVVPALLSLNLVCFLDCNSS